MWCFVKMIDGSRGYLGNPAVETAGFKMLDGSVASIVGIKFSRARNFLFFHEFSPKKRVALPNVYEIQTTGQISRWNGEFSLFKIFLEH